MTHNVHETGNWWKSQEKLLIIVEIREMEQILFVVRNISRARWITIVRSMRMQTLALQIFKTWQY